jgi:hypothetical protein
VEERAMFIETSSPTAVSHPRGRRIRGETAYVITDVVIHHELAAKIGSDLDIETQLEPLTSRDGRHTYCVTVYGYTIAQFVAIVTAYAQENFIEAVRLIREVAPRPTGLPAR